MKLRTFLSLDEFDPLPQLGAKHVPPQRLVAPPLPKRLPSGVLVAKDGKMRTMIVENFSAPNDAPKKADLSHLIATGKTFTGRLVGVHDSVLVSSNGAHTWQPVMTQADYSALEARLLARLESKWADGTPKRGEL